jgi:hypothetical protein
MFKQVLLSSISLFIFFHSIVAQHVKELNNNGESSLRGLSVVDDHVLWVSGSKGSVAVSYTHLRAHET